MALSPEAARSASGRHGSPWRAAGLVLVVLLTLTGAGLIGLAVTAPDPDRPPQPELAAAPPFLPSPSPDASTAAGPSASASPTAAGDAGRAEGTRDGRDDRSGGATSPPPTAAPKPTPAGLPRSQPTRIKIPRIGVDAEITALGLDEKQRIAVPPPKLTGWYKLGPSPGEVGTAVVVGHLDSRADGRAVFFRLGSLKPGDTIEVLREDGKKALFKVDGAARYPKSKFPSELVYRHTDKAQLRLITCGGEFDKAAKSYKDNVVIFASLVPTGAT